MGTESTLKEPLRHIGAALLRAFVAESNRIEGICREPTQAEVDAHERFLALPKIGIENLEALVAVLQPDAVLRDKPGLNVRIGRYVAPPGGSNIRYSLLSLLLHLGTNPCPWRKHIAYERLHPFTDGNGRSGRAIWAWQMVRRPEGLSLDFLHRWYYQTLEQGSSNR